MKRPSAPVPQTNSSTSEPASSATKPEPEKYESGKVALERLEHGLENFKNVSEGWGPGLGQNIDPGDEFTFTKGAETYSPVPYHSFTVGPFTAKVKVRKGEGLEDLYVRAYKFLTTVFEAEFEIQKKQFFERLAEAGEASGRKSGVKK